MANYGIDFLTLLSYVFLFSKILGKIVCSQVMACLKEQNILEVFQSGLKHYKALETALLRVFIYIFFTTDSSDCVILVLLDLTAAFDIVDHKILLTITLFLKTSS